MKLLQKSIAVLLIVSLLSCFGSMLCVAGEEDFSYSTLSGQVTILSYNGTSPNVVVPETIEGNPVTAIDEEAFADSNKIVSVTLPSSVKRIETNQFSNCTALESVDFGGCTTIGNSAFWSCTALKTMNIPDTVTTIEPAAFRDCTALESVTFGKGVTALPSNLFDMCTALKTVFFGENIVSVHEKAFNGCFTNGGDLYIFAKTNTFPVSVLPKNFSGTIHCFEDTPIYDLALEQGWNMVTFDEDHIEVTVDEPLTVTASQTAQSVPTQGVHVYEIFSDSTNESAVLPKVDLTARAIFPSTMVFDTVGTASVTVSANGFYASYDVTVTEPVVETGIRIASTPTAVYTASETVQAVDKTGLTVFVQYSNGTEQDVTAECTVPATKLFNQVGTMKVTVGYKTFSTTYDVTVVAPIVATGIRIQTAPTNTLYYLSESEQTVDTTGLCVVLRYSDGHEVDVTADCEVNTTQTFYSEGIHYVAVQYGDFIATFPITVRTANLSIQGGKCIQKKIALFSSYKKNPVQLAWTGIEESQIAEVHWRIKEGQKFTVDGNGKVTYTGGVAATGVAELTVLDIHGVTHTAEIRIIFYRFSLSLPIRFSRFL